MITKFLGNKKTITLSCFISLFLFLVWVCVENPEPAGNFLRFVIDHPSVGLLLIAMFVFWSCVYIVWNFLKTNNFIVKYPFKVSIGACFLAASLTVGGLLVHLVESSVYKNSKEVRVYTIVPPEIRPRLDIIADACSPVLFGIVSAKVDDSSVCATALLDGRRASIFTNPDSLDKKRFHSINGSSILQGLKADYLVGVKLYNEKMAGKVVIKPKVEQKLLTMKDRLAEVSKR